MTEYISMTPILNKGIDFQYCIYLLLTLVHSVGLTSGLPHLDKIEFTMIGKTNHVQFWISADQHTLCLNQAYQSLLGQIDVFWIDIASNVGSVV